VVEHDPRKPEGALAESVIAAFIREYASDEPPELEFGSGTRAKRSQAASEPRLAPPPTDGPEYRSGGRIRADLLVAACIAFVGVSLVLSGIAKARHQSRVYACQNSLRTLHVGLAGYADSDPQGRYPQIGTPTHPTADTFAASLTDLGYLPSGYKPGCPVAPDSLPYTYTLGFRGPNDELLGLRRPADNSCGEEIDLMPIAADCPSSSAAPGAGPLSPHGHSMNVLFVGGNVRLTTSPNVGPRGDDIYRNVFGHVAAGANRNDAVLGRPGDKP
jgi:prepilin-type processing-associated H-X9-DG protein